jgi:predicted NAD/FAD-binding protein
MGPILTTLNPYCIPDPTLTQGTFTYEHPVYDSTTLKAQNKLRSIQGSRNIWFAGAWLGYGFYEDGCTLGLQVAKMMCPEIQLPFPLTDWKVESSRSPRDWQTSRYRILKLFMILVHGLIMGLITSHPRRVSPR